MSTIDKIILNTENTENFIRNLMSSLVNGIRSSNSIPSGGDYEYYSTFPKFLSDTKSLTNDTTSLIHEISKLIQPSSLELSPDLMDSSLYEHVVDMIDMLLERASLNLEEESGVIPSSNAIRDTLLFDRQRIFQGTNLSLPKPQMDFLSDIDNSRVRPFYPKLRSKPNANPNCPLDLTEHNLDVSSEEQLVYVGPKTYYFHPYETEIKDFLKNIPSLSTFDEIPTLKSQMPPPLTNYPLAYVETTEELMKMIREIANESAIAVDLEHHDFRSFQGLTCLMQISTRSKDYIVDTLALRKDMIHLLPVFTSPDVVKVFHGCDHDILWLQRDFGLYIVNCFDTYHAAKLLRYPALSLAHLLKYYCGIILNKKYQLADWRIRPLTPEMLQYAQSDTHYLLYIYDNIRKDVYNHQGVNGIIAVLQSSQRTCLKRYEKDYFYPHGYLNLLSKKASNSLTMEQNLILGHLWNWRDIIARKEDESVTYIMSNAELIRIGLKCPKSETEFFECGPFSEYLTKTRGIISYLIHFICQELNIKTASSEILSLSDLESNISEMDIRHRAGSSNASIEEIFLDDSFANSSNSLRTITPEEYSKPINVYAAHDGRFGQISRLQGCNTIKEIHPAISGRDIVMASPGAALFLASTTPIKNFDDDKQFELHSEMEWKQLFLDAQWKGSASPLRPNSTGCFSPEFEAVFAAPGINPDQIPPQLKLTNLNFPSFSSTPLATDPIPDTETKMEEALAGDHGKITPDELPQSLKEIYNISNKNRWKNKDKKRNRDVDHSDNPEYDDNSKVGNTHGSHITEGVDWLDVTNSEVEKTPEGSLDFAIQIGWVDRDSKTSILEKHFADEHANSTAQLQSPSGEDHSRPGSENSEHTSHSKKGNKSSSGGNNKPHLKPRSNSGDRKMSSSFDYSKISNSAAVSAMSGLTNQHQSITSRPLSSSAPNMLNRNHDRRQHNPFVHSGEGGGVRSRGNSRERVNTRDQGNSRERGNKGNQGNNKPHHGPMVEKREKKERSHVFSK